VATEAPNVSEQRKGDVIEREEGQRARRGRRRPERVEQSYEELETASGSHLDLSGIVESSAVSCETDQTSSDDIDKGRKRRIGTDGLVAHTLRRLRSDV
jgi:hypothetical protein